jgi:hypothetical protein
LQARNLPPSAGLVLRIPILSLISDDDLLVPAGWNRIDTVALLSIEEVMRPVQEAIQVVERCPGGSRSLWVFLVQPLFLSMLAALASI